MKTILAYNHPHTMTRRMKKRRPSTRYVADLLAFYVSHKLSRTILRGIPLPRRWGLQTHILLHITLHPLDLTIKNTNHPSRMKTSKPLCSTTKIHSPMVCPSFPLKQSADKPLGQAEHRNDILLTPQYNHLDDSMSDAGIKSSGSDGILASHESIGSPSLNRVFSVSSPSTNGSMPHTSTSSRVSILKRVPLSEPPAPSRPSPNAHTNEASPDYDEFLSRIPSPDSFLREQGDQFVQSSLLDVMDGHLFEDSDPWGALQRLLDVGSPRPRDRSQTSSSPIAHESRTASSTSNTHTLGPHRSVELAQPLFGPEFADTEARKAVGTSAPEIPLKAWLEDILECDTMESTQQSASTVHRQEPAQTPPPVENTTVLKTIETYQGDSQKLHEVYLPTILDVTSGFGSEHCAEDYAATDSGQTPTSSEQQSVAGPALFSDDDDA